MLRPTPGALTSHLLEERPANLPTQLYVCGGRSPSHFSVVVFEEDGPRLQRLEHPEELAAVSGLGVTVWLRGLGGSVEWVVSLLTAVILVAAELCCVVV